MLTTKTPQLTIQIVGWNSAEYLEAAARALQAVRAGAAIIRYIDNNSSDHSVSIIRKMLPQAEVIELPHNVGFARAHNIGFARCTTDFVLTHDPDVQIIWPAIEKLLQTFQDPKIAAVQGKLVRAAEPNTIDSAGIELTLTRNGRERGAGHTDTGQYDHRAEIIAVTGACGLYRMSALRQVQYKNNAEVGLEVFDNDFFAYKEDVDLGWRLARAGWRAFYQPVLMGEHHRTLGQRGRLPWALKARGLYKRLQTPRTRYSLRNYVWMLIKNMSLADEVRYDLFIALRLAYFVGLSVIYPPLLTVWPEVLRGIPIMLKKRVNSRNQPL